MLLYAGFLLNKELLLKKKKKYLRLAQVLLVI